MEIPIRCSYDKLVKLSALKPHPKNRNKHPAEQITRLAEIIKYQGIRHPIKISRRSGFITAGHGRLEAFRQLKLKTVPVDVQAYDSEEQEYADIQSDNAIALWAELDLSGINTDIIELGPDFDINLLGIKDFVLEPAEKIPQSDEDAVPDKVDTRAKLGDRWTLGNHVLVCGDSTDVCAVDLLMMGEKADMVFTDPPYGMNLDTDYLKMPENACKSNSYKRVIGDDKDFDPRPLIEMAECEIQFWWGADWYYESIPPKGSWLCWSKRNETALGLIGNHFEMCWMKQGGRRRLIHKHWSGYTAHDPGEKRVHPTQKPIAVCIDAMAEFAKDGIVFDPFGGSGSTLIACEKTNRKCYMMEIDPHYCDVILSRWEKYTGKQAVLEAGGLDGQA